MTAHWKSWCSMHTKWDAKQSWEDNENYFFENRCLWKLRCKRLALLRAQYSSLLVRFGCIHDGRCNFSVLSDTVLSPTAEAESFVTRDIWKTVFLNEALQQSNNDSADKKLPCHLCPFPVWQVMSFLVHIAPSCLCCTRETLARVRRRPMCFPFTTWLFILHAYLLHFDVIIV